MQPGFLLIILGLAQMTLGLSADSGQWMLLWSGVSFSVAGLGYSRLGPRVFGKRADGTLSGWNRLLLAPYLLLTWLLWQLQRLIGREDACNEVSPGIWLGRRPFPHELPSGVTLVVDLTAEFAAARGIATGRDYLCLPILDTSVPPESDFQTLLTKLVAWKEPVYIHCASGHGRSALIVIALLIQRDIVGSIAEAEAQVKQARPQIGLSRAQRRLLEKCVSAPSSQSINTDAHS